MKRPLRLTVDWHDGDIRVLIRNGRDWIESYAKYTPDMARKIVAKIQKLLEEQK